MIAAFTTLLLLMAPAAAAPPSCPDWRALADGGETIGLFDVSIADVESAFQRAAEAAACSKEPAEVSDRLWLRFADWLSIEHPDEALAFLEKRRELIRTEHGRSHPREAPNLWLESRILAHERRDDRQVEKPLKEALRIMHDALGDSSPGVAAAYLHLASFYQNRGRNDVAHACIERALQAAEQSGRAGRGELYQALEARYYVLDALNIRPAEREKLMQRRIALDAEFEADGWKLPDENYWP